MGIRTSGEYYIGEYQGNKQFYFDHQDVAKEYTLHLWKGNVIYLKGDTKNLIFGIAKHLGPGEHH